MQIDESEAHVKIEKWARWMMMSDYPSMSVQHPDKASGIRGTNNYDSIAEMRVVLAYSQIISSVNTVIKKILPINQRTFIVLYYLTPAKKDPTTFTMERMRIGKTKFKAMKRETLCSVASALQTIEFYRKDGFL